MLIIFFFNDTATTEIYTLSLHDALPICDPYYACYPNFIRYAEGRPVYVGVTEEDGFQYHPERSEEHTSELQSQSNLVCRLLLEKKKRILLFLMSMYSLLL